MIFQATSITGRRQYTTDNLGESPSGKTAPARDRAITSKGPTAHDQSTGSEGRQGGSVSSGSSAERAHYESLDVKKQPITKRLLSETHHVVQRHSVVPMLKTEVFQVCTLVNGGTREVLVYPWLLVRNAKAADIFVSPIVGLSAEDKGESALATGATDLGFLDQHAVEEEVVEDTNAVVGEAVEDAHTGSGGWASAPLNLGKKALGAPLNLGKKGLEGVGSGLEKIGFKTRHSTRGPKHGATSGGGGWAGFFGGPEEDHAENRAWHGKHKKPLGQNKLLSCDMAVSGGAISFRRDTGLPPQHQLSNTPRQVGLALSFATQGDLYRDEESCWSYPLAIPVTPDRKFFNKVDKDVLQKPVPGSRAGVWAKIEEPEVDGADGGGRGGATSGSEKSSGTRSASSAASSDRSSGESGRGRSGPPAADASSKPAAKKTPKPPKPPAGPDASTQWLQRSFLFRHPRVPHTGDKKFQTGDQWDFTKVTLSYDIRLSCWVADTVDGHAEVRVFFPRRRSRRG